MSVPSRLPGRPLAALAIPATRAIVGRPTGVLVSISTIRRSTTNSPSSAVRPAFSSRSLPSDVRFRTACFSISRCPTAPSTRTRYPRRTVARGDVSPRGSRKLPPSRAPSHITRNRPDTPCALVGPCHSSPATLAPALQQPATGALRRLRHCDHP